MGIHRKVQLKNSYVIKVARNRISRECNRVEWELSDTSRYFAKCPMVSPDYRELRMERVQIPGVLTRMKYAKFLRKELKGISDIHWYNVGETHGHPVLYDYGGTLIILRLIARKIRLAIGMTSWKNARRSE